MTVQNTTNVISDIQRGRDKWFNLETTTTNKNTHTWPNEEKCILLRGQVSFILWAVLYVGVPDNVENLDPDFMTPPFPPSLSASALMAQQN